jgi:hypothetical protein
MASNTDLVFPEYSAGMESEVISIFRRIKKHRRHEAGGAKKDRPYLPRMAN